MSPKRVIRWGREGTARANRHPFLTSLAMSTIVIVVFATLLDQKDGDLESQDGRLAQQDAQLEQLFECAQEYVEASNAATLPIREATTELQAADDRLWHFANLVITQQGSQEDYRELRQAISARDHLADELREAREENPPPPPPETFCGEENAAVANIALVVEDAALGEETPNCATHGEWDNVQPFMRTWRIAEIIGNNGWFINTANPDTFARGYNLCWTTNFGKVWFDSESGLSIRKDVI